MSDLSPMPEEMHGTSVAEEAEADAPRKPRLAIMGEFSAGKSTLSNLLLGARPLPERVTATRLSPVWLNHGTANPVAMAIDGTETPIAIEDLDLLDVDSTRYVSMSLESPILEHCDLIDFPGISDPNMDSDVWERMLPEVDLVLWCTHATQAWRQSEAAAWDLVTETVRARSMLLVTRFDKLVTERDRARVLARVAAETEGLFAGIYPLSLLDALKATEAEDADGWDQSGAKTFASDLHLALAAFDPSIPVPPAAQDGAEHAADPASETASEPTGAASLVRRIIPRRVRPSGRTARPRPSD